MDDQQLLARLSSIDSRLGGVEKSVNFINHELGTLSGRSKNSIAPMLIKYVAFPLIIVIGAVMGVRMAGIEIVSPF